jgi:hypothetical protein
MIGDVLKWRGMGLLVDVYGIQWSLLDGSDHRWICNDEARQSDPVFSFAFHQKTDNTYNDFVICIRHRRFWFCSR